MRMIVPVLMVALTVTACTREDKKMAGTLVGAAGGALIGSQFGGGAGSVVAGAVGAAGGAFLGNTVADKMSQ